MPNWILTTWPTLLAAIPREEEEFVTELRHIPDGWWAVCAAAAVVLICAAVAWMYRHEGRRGAAPRVRVVMAVIRCLVLLGLAIILLEPVRVRILRRWVDSYTILLVDDSSSMDLADRYRTAEEAGRIEKFQGAAPTAAVRRADLVQEVLGKDDRRFLRELSDKNRVRLYGFGSEPTLRATAPAAHERMPKAESADAEAQQYQTLEALPIEFSARGATTNLERALRRAVESLGSAPIASVVVLSDGGFNDGAAAEDIAQFARERNIPVHTVGIGDPAPPRNVRVAEITAPENVFQHDPFAVTARISAQGVEGDVLQVELRERDEAGGSEGRVVDSKQAVVGTDGAVEPLRFERLEERVGRFTYSVTVTPLSGESMLDDNSRQTTINVIDSRLRVLIVAGGPSWDYRFLARLLERDETIDVSCWLQTADLNAVRDGDMVIDHLPRLAEELFEYDVIILMDPDHTELDEPWSRLVDQFVSEHGGGLLYAAARPRTPALMREAALKPLLDLLPVTLDPESDLVLNRVGHYQQNPSPIEIPPTMGSHPMLQLADDPVSSKLLWQSVGEVFWHFPVMREKPAATVLMRHGDPRMKNSYGGHVLAAVQYVGAGRAAFFAFDATWRWRPYGEAVFDRFWIQTIRYLAEGRVLGGTRRATLLTENDQYSVGDAVGVTARLLDERFEPIRRDQMRATVQVDNEQSDLVLTPQRDRPGWYAGRFVPNRTGSHRVSLRLPTSAADEEEEVSREILVARPNIEVLKPQMNRDELVTLAEGSAGGKYFAVDEAAQLPALIADMHEEIPIRSRPQTLWDRGFTLALLLGLLTTEWFLRKWNRLL